MTPSPRLLRSILRLAGRLQDQQRIALQFALWRSWIKRG